MIDQATQATLNSLMIITGSQGQTIIRLTNIITQLESRVVQLEASVKEPKEKSS